MFMEAVSVAQQSRNSESVPVESREIYSSWHVQPRSLGGTGELMEAYAILSWLSVNASLSYMLRGQLR